VVGLLIALPRSSRIGAGLPIALAIWLALCCLPMRASFLFLISATVIAVRTEWRSLLVMGACALPLIIVGALIPSETKRRF
jgi:hypothetical protein